MKRLVAVLLSCLTFSVTGANALAQNLLTVGPSGTPDDIRALVAAGADLEARSEGYMTPLMATAASGPLENVRTLLELGANPRATDYQGGTALHHAVVRMDSAAEVTRLLLAAGIDVDARLADGITPLMQAAGFGTSDTVTALIEVGAGLDFQDGHGKTALMNAARYGDPESILALLDAGAKTGLRDSDGLNALDLAAQNYKLDGARFALGPGPDLPTGDTDLGYEDDFDLEAFLDEMEQQYEDFDREAFYEEWERSEAELAATYGDGFAQEPDAAQLAYERLLAAEQ